MRNFYYRPDKKGVDIICDCCGNSVFLERLGETGYVNGVYKTETYEPAPEGWQYDPSDTAVLCPICAAKASDESLQV